MLNMLNKGDCVAIVRCSDALSDAAYAQTLQVKEIFEARGIKVHLHEECFFDGEAARRADVLNACFADSSVNMILDVSGGDAANELLDCLDYAIIKANPKPFVGYSDLTCIHNAIYAQTGNAGLLFNARNLAHGNMAETVFRVRFLRGECLEGTVLGGNVRCLLKTAGTLYFPNMEGKVLFLESYGGGEERVRAYFAQLTQMGVFRKVTGVLLGTFTELDSKCSPHTVEDIAKAYLPENLPLARTNAVGHARDSKALWIGKQMKWE